MVCRWAPLVIVVALCELGWMYSIRNLVLLCGAVCAGAVWWREDRECAAGARQPSASGGGRAPFLSRRRGLWCARI